MNSEKRPSRFMAPWLAHEKFKDLLHTSWSSREGNLLNNITFFTGAIKIWNEEVFGHILGKKNLVLLRMEGIFRSLSFHENKFLEKLHRDLWKEDEEVLIQDELYWK